MLSYILSQISSYQIFRSVLFRGALGYITAYLIVSFIMPWMIVKFRKLGFYSDINKDTPLMGGILLILAILVAMILWSQVWAGPYVLALAGTMAGFGLIGFADDLQKIRNRKKIVNQEQSPLNYSTKTDGLSERVRFGLELVLALVILAIVFFVLLAVDTRLQIPFVPIKNFFPALPLWFYYIIAALLIVVGANAVNMADGLDTMASIPMITCLVFTAVVSYLSGDAEWSTRLKLPFIDENLKEVTIFCCIMIGALVAFLKYNSPPASIYLGDIGSLGLGAAVTMSFIFVKAEIFLALAGGIFFITGLSSLIQRSYFKLMLKLKGREYAEKNRFFFRAPYHHHLQHVFAKDKQAKMSAVNSHFDRLIKRIWFYNPGYYIQNLTSQDGINSKIVWINLIRAIFLLILALIVFLKIR